MTTAEITRELRAARPAAPPALRARIVATTESAPRAQAQPRWRPRRRGLLALVPAAATIAVAGAVVVGVTRPSSTDDGARTALEASADTTAGADQSLAAPPVAGSTAKLGAEARAQRTTAAITVRVDDGEALSGAASEALRITRGLGGYVVSSNVTAGDDGAGSLTLRVPAASAQEAIDRLSALGTIVDQRVQVDDLQAALDSLVVQLRRTRAALATVRARLAEDDLSSEERARLQVRRDELVGTLATLTAQQQSTEREAAEATIQLELRTDRSAGAIAPPSRLDRTVDRALDVLAWEAAAMLALTIVAAPFALLALSVWLARRLARRRADDRLLGVA
ncbi:MAG: DUF4349 domain-containing protein [Gaiella sp.]